MSITVITPLKGHTDEASAYVVDDYPYGFHLRCKIRYWLEYRKGHGFRLVSQTTNPKKAGEVWNKPKASVYANLGVMGLDDKGHVTWTGLHYNFEDLAEFVTVYGESFGDDQRRVAEAMKLSYERYLAKKSLT